MGAGIDPKVLHRRIYGRLQTIKSKLERAGVQCTYRDLELNGPTFAIYFAGIGPASNGESMRYLVLRFNESTKPSGSQKREGDVDYTNWHTRKIPENTFDAGWQRITNEKKTS